jgi:hypothetical protein
VKPKEPNVKPNVKKEPNVKPVNTKKEPNVKPNAKKEPNVKPMNTKKEPNVKPVNAKEEPNVKPNAKKEPNVKPVKPVNKKESNVKPNNKKEPNVKPMNKKEPNVKPNNKKEPNVKPNAKKEPNVKPVKPVNKKEPNTKPVNKKEPNTKPVNKKEPNVKPVNAKKEPNTKPVNTKKEPNVKPNNKKEPNTKPVNKKEPNVKPVNAKKEPNTKPVNKKEPNVKPNNKKEPNTKPVNKKEPNVKPNANAKPKTKVNKFADQKALAKYLQNVGMNRGNRKTFVARLKSEKLNAIRANAKKFMNAKKEPTKPETKVNKFANQKALAKYLQNVGMNRGNRKTFVARLKSEKLNAIRANAKKFMNAKKEPNTKPETKVNKFANQKALAKYLQNVGMNRGNRKTYMARLKTNSVNAIKADAKKFMNKPKELSNTDKGVRWKLFNSPKYNKLTVKEREDLFKRWMNKKNKTIWANAQKLQASKTKNVVSVKTNAPKPKPVTTNMKKEFQNLMKAKGVSADSAFKRLSLKYHPNKGGKQENFIRLQSIRNELKKNTGRQTLLNRINKNVPSGTDFSQGRTKWKSAIKSAKNSELSKISSLLDNKLKLKKNINTTVKNSRKKKELLYGIMAYKNDTANRRKKMLALPAPKPVNKFANQKALSRHLQNLNMNRSDRAKFMTRLKTEKLNAIKANAKKFMNTRAIEAKAKAKANKDARREREEKARIAKAKANKDARREREEKARIAKAKANKDARREREEKARIAKKKANARRKANNNARREREKKARIAKASQPRVAPRSKKVKAKYRKRR